MAASDTSPAAENPYVLNLMNIYGALLLAGLFSCVLYGMVCIQMFLYYFNYERDSKYLKLYVFFLWCLETASVVLIAVSLFPSLILKWGSLQEVAKTQFTVLQRLWLSSLSTILVQLFFLYRIHQLSGNRWLPICLIPFMMYEFAHPIIYVVLAYQGTSLSTISGNISIDTVVAGRATIAFVDVVIMVAMVFYLSRSASTHWRFGSTQKMIGRLIIMSINTGLWTAVLSVIVVPLLVHYPNSLYYCIVDFPLTSLYLNALLANLNAREFIRNTSGGTHDYNSFALEAGTVVRLADFSANTVPRQVPVAVSINASETASGMRNSFDQDNILNLKA